MQLFSPRRSTQVVDGSVVLPTSWPCRTVREVNPRRVRGRERKAFRSVTGHADPARMGLGGWGWIVRSAVTNIGFRLLGAPLNRYDAPMTPPSAVWVFVLAVLLFGGLTAGAASSPVAAAEPGLSMNMPGDDPVESSCSFTLSGPQLTSLPGGAEAVTATVAASACSGNAEATSSTICVSTPDGPGDCVTAPAWNTAQVFVTASKLTGRFTARANGCWQVLGATGATYTCAPLGPVMTTI